jgi:dihydrofolate synthase/folylpolyglutamate synthase
MKHHSLADWLFWLETSHPQEIDLGLARVSKVASRLDLLKPSALVITVAGTNGKGSCVAATAAILRAAGRQVGVYTSPHLLDYNERIQINDDYASDQSICIAFEQIYQAATAENISLTYFEYGTLAAFYLFKQEGLDVWVLEVGLGGRLDAVNLLDADIAIITSIDLDHQDWLGDDREKIGYEKAGIMRSGKPMICADANPPHSLIAHAAALGVEPFYLGRDFFYDVEDNQWRWWNSSVSSEWQTLPHLPLPSMAAALQLAAWLKLDFYQLDIFNQIAGLSVFGRFHHLFMHQRQWALDVAHNPAATALLSSRLIKWKQQHPDAKIYALVAMMSDKDRLASLSNLQADIDFWYLGDLSFLPRAATIQQMWDNLTSLNLKVEASGSVSECLQKMIQQSEEQDLLLVFGSFYTVAETMKFLGVSLVGKPGGDKL